VPRNPNKRPCSVPGCRAWVIRGSDPPRCSAHTPGKTGAPSGNRNSLTHGFYASTLHPDERSHLHDDTISRCSSRFTRELPGVEQSSTHTNLRSTHQHAHCSSRRVTGEAGHTRYCLPEKTLIGIGIRLSRHSTVTLPFLETQKRPSRRCPTASQAPSSRCYSPCGASICRACQKWNHLTKVGSFILALLGILPLAVTEPDRTVLGQQVPVCPSRTNCPFVNSLI
jgi:hypothetical protein